jgi:Sugar phosphate permease
MSSETKMDTSSATQMTKPTRARYFVCFLLCVLMAINYLDRANLSVAAPAIGRELDLNPAMMGMIFSAFGWTYTIMQAPSGWFIDRFGPRVISGVAILGWSLVTLFIGFSYTLTLLILCRMVLGFFEAPIFPVAGRVVAAWFPANERGMATGAYTAAEYIGLAFCTPFLTWLLVSHGWNSLFVVTGALGLVFALFWFMYYRDPVNYKGVNQAELDLIRRGGGLSDSVKESKKISWQEARHLFRHRQLWGMYLGQFCMTQIMFFFMTWFPSYLVMEKKMTIIKMGFYAAIPFIAAICGVFVAGKWSDWMIARGYTTVARKLPVIVGLFLACTLMSANYTDSINLVISIMSLAYFGQGMAATIAWALLTDIAPRELVGLTGGVFNLFANLGGTLCPMVIGFIVNATHSFTAALVYVSCIALVGALSYIFIIGTTYRIEIPKEAD